MLSYFRLESKIHALGYPIFWSEKWVGNRVMLNLQARHDHAVQHLQTLKPTFVPKYPLSDAHPWDECKFVGGTKIVLGFFFPMFFCLFLKFPRSKVNKSLVDLTWQQLFFYRVVPKCEKRQMSHFAIKLCRSVYGHPIIISPVLFVEFEIYIYFRPIRDFGPTILSPRIY